MYVYFLRQFTGPTNLYSLLIHTFFLFELTMLKISWDAFKMFDSIFTFANNTFRRMALDLVSGILGRLSSAYPRATSPTSRRSSRILFELFFSLIVHIMHVGDAHKRYINNAYILLLVKLCRSLTHYLPFYLLLRALCTHEDIIV